MLKSLMAGFVLLALFPAAGFAQDMQDQRYQIEKTKYGFVRLDKRTGAMTFCREDKDALACNPAAAERTEVEADLAGLVEKLAALEERVNSAEARAIAAEDAANAAMEKVKSLAETAISRPTLPSEKDVDEALSFMERFMRRFMDMSRDLNQEKGLPQRS